ncbi:MAG: helix-turn-helix domain-containing protein [Sphingomonadales bacterium]|jgi:DNA-binding transcriptional ArsR family regulator
MNAHPNISKIASVIASPVREGILRALLSGMALTPNELCRETGVQASTLSGHLRVLEGAGLICALRQGRFKYFKLKNDEVAHNLEALFALGAAFELSHIRPGPKNEELRAARRCYSHLAGRLGVRIFQSMYERGFVKLLDSEVSLTDEGKAFLVELGVDVNLLAEKAKPLCRTCLDWSERRYHLSGEVGKALLTLFLDKDWIQGHRGERSLLLTPSGVTCLENNFPIKKRPHKATVSLGLKPT